MTRSRLVFTTGVGLLAASFFLVSCDGDGPAGPAFGGVSPAETSQTFEELLTDFVVENQTVESTESLAPFITFITTIESSIIQFATASGTGIPDFLMGVTCVWNPEEERYVGDPEDAGLAPDSGIRFRLYAIDESTDLPTVPLEDVGFTDIVDLSSGTTIDVSFVGGTGGEVQVPDPTLLDFALNGTLSETFDLTLSGFLSNGSEQLDFDFPVSGTPDDISTMINVTADPFALTIDFQGSTSGAGEFTFTVLNPASEDILDFSFTTDSEGQITAGTVSLNGQQIGTISGDTENPMIAASNESDLSSGDADDLESVVGNVNLLLETFAGIFEFGLSITGATSSAS